MIKRLIQQIAPSFLLDHYKKKQFYRTIKNFQVKDEPDLLIAQKLVSPKDTILDIGANIGLYIHFLSPFVKNVIGFEPVPFTFSVLENNARLFGWENIELHQVAISDNNGKAVIQIPIQAGVRNYFRASLSNRNKKEDSDMSFTVKTQTLNSFLAQKPNSISFIKCDTEGHELPVIIGAHEYLKENRPAWLIEISGNPDDLNSEAATLVQLLKNLDYHIYLYESQVMRKREEGDQSVNYFFLQNTHLKTLQENSIPIELP